MIAPVTNITAGVSPKTAQINFTVMSHNPRPVQPKLMPLMYTMQIGLASRVSWSTVRVRALASVRLDAIEHILKLLR